MVMAALFRTTAAFSLCTPRFPLSSSSSPSSPSLSSSSSSSTTTTITTIHRAHPLGIKHRPPYAHSSASAAAATDDSPDLRGLEGVKSDLGAELLACPICFERLGRLGPAGYNQAAIAASSFTCKRCKKEFTSNKTFLDLTVTAGAEYYEEGRTPSTEIFRNPIVSFVYERGWRQSFEFFGYPGPEEELRIANNYLKSAAGGVLVDVSCASGVSTRRFVKSGLYSCIIALDFSESMLQEFQRFIEQDMTLKTCNLSLIRADVARLPFATGTIDAVYAGAAIHCWPSPSNGVAEISRILKPGGVYVATTNALDLDLIKPAKQVIRGTYGSQVLWSEKELEELCRSCGLTNWTSFRRFAFIMFSVQKPL